MPLKIFTEKKDREYAVGRGGSLKYYSWVAWRDTRPTVRGYGKTEIEAIDDLKYSVQPDWDGTLDGEGTPSGTIIGGNMFPHKQIIDNNRSRFKK